MKTLRLFFLIGFINLVSIAHARDQDDSLTIMTATQQEITLSKNDLLKRHTAQFNMRDSRAYLGKLVHYTAIRLCDLLKPYQIKPTDTIEFISSDHFYAFVPANRVMSCQKKTAVAYLGIETKTHPWPKLYYNNPNKATPDDGTAGPFAILWQHPEKSYISDEYWAWKLSKIKIHSKVENGLLISAPTSHDQQITNGYYAYVSRCSGCHTINHIGKATIGPDLNKPTNPVTYFTNDETIKRFIRNPQSVRYKPNDRMSAINERSLSKRDLDDLIQYLHYITNHN